MQSPEINVHISFFLIEIKTLSCNTLYNILLKHNIGMFSIHITRITNYYEVLPLHGALHL